MTEMPDAGEDHGDVVPVASGDGVGIADRTTRLSDCGDARLRRLLDVVREWEESVGSQHRAAAALPGLLHRLLNREHTAHLSRPDADDHAALRQHDGVALDMLAHFPGELHIGKLRRGRLALGYR